MFLCGFSEQPNTLILQIGDCAMCSVRSSSCAKFSLKCNNIYAFFLTKTLFHKTFMLEHDLRTKK